MLNERDQSDAAMTGATHHRASWWIIACALIVGVAIGRGLSSGPAAIAADPNTDATATRTAELAELNDMRTKIAQPVVCTPPPEPTSTNTPEPTSTPTVVPAVSAGQEVPYGDVFTITVAGIVSVGTPVGFQPNGMYLRVDVVLKNLTGAVQTPPFEDWRLVDANGNKYRIDSQATAEIVSRYWGIQIDKYVTETRGLIFNVAVDAGTTFTLESEREPAFRVELIVESRG